MQKKVHGRSSKGNIVEKIGHDKDPNICCHEKKIAANKVENDLLAPLLKLAWQICRVRNLNVFLKQKMRNIFFHTHLSHTLTLSLFHTHFSSTGLVHRCSTWSAGDTNYRTSSSWIPSNSSTRSNARNSGFVAFLPNPFWTVSKNEDPRPIGKSLQTIEFEKVKKTGKMLRTVTKMDLSYHYNEHFVRCRRCSLNQLYRIVVMLIDAGGNNQTL